MSPLTPRAVIPEATAGSGGWYAQGKDQPDILVGTGRPVPLLSLTSRRFKRRGGCMATWMSEIGTKKAFANRLKRAPELIFVRGVMHGRFGLQSLPTVLDELAEVHVANWRAGWSCIVQRRGRDRFWLFEVRTSLDRMAAGAAGRSVGSGRG